MRGYDEDDIVVSGIGGHFPECDNLDELMNNLMNGVDMVTEGRPRWEPGELGVTTRTGKMKSIEMCDAQYFGLIGKQCQALDPITRKFLERTYEALFDAGLNPSDLVGTKTGVFSGLSILESEMILMDSKDFGAYNILGRNKTMNANRLSYWLDLKGPSLSVDSTWSSGLQVLAVAYQFMKSGLCDAAIIGAGATIIHSYFSKHFQNLKMLSPDGKSKAFDESANGFARSEAVVVLLLQKAKDAKRNYGIVVNATCQCMGFESEGLLVPTKESWLKVYKEFYEDCKVDPNQVTYVEADGMASQDADKAELNAIEDFFGRERDPSQPLLLGSVKSNMGHTMASAGLCSLAKVLIANKTGVIPPNLHYSEPNKSVVGLLSGKMKVVTEPTSMNGEYLAINNYGFGGTYGHCLIRRAPERERIQQSDNMPRLVLFSARNEDGIQDTLNVIEGLPYSAESVRLIHDVFSKTISHHMYRGFTILPKETSAKGTESFSGDKRPIWFIFSGMGSHWATMGKGLMRIPLFKKSIDICHKVLEEKGLDLWDILTRDDNSLFDNIVNSFVSISSTQIALVDILHAIGIRPDGIIGHSAGELGAAYADGCLTREEMILASYARGKVSNEVKVIKGMMAAVGAGYAQMKDQLPEDIEVACHNSSTSCTISGPADKIVEFMEKLKNDGVFVKAVNTSNIAFHSKHIRHMGPKLQEELQKIIRNPKKRSSKWITSSVPESDWDNPEWSYCSAEYQTNNLLSSVYFEEACKKIPKNAIVIEIAPHSLLLSVLKRALSPDCINVGLTHRHAPDQTIYLLQSIGKLYTIGLQPQVSALYPDVEYPVSYSTPFLGNLATWDHSFLWSWRVPVKEGFETGYGKGCKIFVLYLDEEPHCTSFRFDENSVLPYSVLMRLILEAFASLKQKKISEIAATFHDVFFTRPVKINKMRSMSLEIMRNAGTGEFELLIGDEVIVTGFVNDTESKKLESVYFDKIESPKTSIDKDEIYSHLMRCGYEYHPSLMNIKEMTNDGCAWEGRVEWKGDVTSVIESAIQAQLFACGDSHHLRELKFVRQLIIDVACMPKDDKELQLTLNTNTDEISTPGLNVKGLKFTKTNGEPLQLNCKTTPPPLQIDNLSQTAWIEYYPRHTTPRQLAYSTNSSNGNTMGVGTLDDASVTVAQDPILSWKIPEDWTVEDATTVPIPYCLAYYILAVISDVKKDKSVLVTNGESNIGMACISVALQYTNDVWVTVSSEKKKEFVLNKFKQLRNNIEVSGEEFSKKILSKKKTTLDIVINVGWERRVEDGLICMAHFGFVFQVYLDDVRENELMFGTNNLLKCGSVHGITLQSVLTARDSDKNRIRDLILDGIKCGAVAPLPKHSLSTKPELIRLDNAERTGYRRHDSYLLVCDKVNTGLHIADHFAKCRAKKITLVHCDKITSSDKINAVRRSVSLTLKKIDSFDEWALKKCMADVRNVDVAVVLPLDKDNATSDYTGAVVRSLSGLERDTHLVCVLKPSSRGVDLCEERSRSGMPTTVFIWKRQINGKLREFTKVLEQVLAGGADSTIEIDEDDNFVNNIEKDIEELLHSLPKDTENIAKYADTLPDVPTVTEMTTLSLPYVHTKEVLPIFLLGGIKNASSLLDKFTKSMYPVFNIELPHLGSSSVMELASYAVPKIKSITKGPYVIVGEQWGGCVALEIGRQLESLGDVAHLFLLAGTPAEVIEPLRYIADMGEPLDISLLSRLLKIKDKRVLQEISNLKNWSKKLSYCAQFIKDEPRDAILKGIDAVKCRLEALLDYSVSTPLNGPITVITKKAMTTEHYKYLSKNRVNIHEVSDGNDILTDAVFTLIEDSAAHKTLSS